MTRSRILIVALMALALGAGAFVYWRSALPDPATPSRPDERATTAVDDSAITTAGAAVIDQDAPSEDRARTKTSDTSSAPAPRPYRASPDQRRHDQQRLLSAEDREALAREFEQRAARGEVDAARAMEELVADCDAARWAADPVQRSFLESLAALGDAHARWVQYSLAHGSAILASCERLLGPVARWPGDLTLPWTECAAALGDPGARLLMGP